MYENIKNLPITPFLVDICKKLKESSSHFLILSAQTGAGKSTALPLALLDNFDGKILMLEPRKMAVLNVAERISHLLGEEPGETCGYTVHLDKKLSKKTRLEVMTDSIFCRRILADNELSGVSVVILDEFHERSVNLDFALALLKELCSLRDNLYVIIMSATIETEKLTKYLSKDFVIGTDYQYKSVPVYKIEGRSFPVKIEYSNQNIENEIISSLNDESLSSGGSILVFLPGIKEINLVKEKLEKSIKNKNKECYILHSSVPIKEQSRLFVSSKSGTVRIILSSAIAETSVTIPDVKIVIDSGFGKYNIFDKKQQMNHLVTQRISKFSAAQRAGRAGRICEGKCIRLWDKNENLTDTVIPEILKIDISQLVLECFAWGVKNFSQIYWLDCPSENEWNTAVILLENLNCIHNGQITELGKAVLFLGIDLRIACVALSGISFDKINASVDFALDLMKKSLKNQSVLELQRNDLIFRINKIQKNSQKNLVFAHKFTEFSTENALLCGYPDRIAKKTVDKLKKSVNKNEKAEYLFPSGKKGFLCSFGNLRLAEKTPEFILAYEVDAGESFVKIYDFFEISENSAIQFFKLKSSVKIFTKFSESEKSKVEKYQTESYGKIILHEKKLPVSSDDYKEAVSYQLKKDGLKFLPMSENSKNLILRYRFFVQQIGTDKNNSAEFEDKIKNLTENPELWLFPFLTDEKLTEKTVFSALNWYLNGNELKKSVPNEILLSNGKILKIKYEFQNEKIIPVSEVIIQHIFSCMKNPKILGMTVLLRLLSPASRPLQVTNDLENFWKNTWPQICSEMRGRYPKHNWDYRVSESD